MSKNTKAILDKLEPLFFPVKKVKASDITDIPFQQNISNLIIVGEGKNQQVINAVSPGYTLISNRELMTPLVEILSENYDVSVKTMNRGNAKFYVDIIFKKDAVEKGELFPRIRLINSYDSSVKYSYSLGFYRLVCDNGLAIPIGEDSTKGMMHTAQVGEGAALQKTWEAMDNFLKDAPKYAEGFNRLRKNKRTLVGAEALLVELSEDVDYPKKLIPQAMARLQTELDLGYTLDDYLIYNSANHALMNSPSEMPEHKRDKLDFNVLTYLLNQ